MDCRQRITLGKAGVSTIQLAFGNYSIGASGEAGPGNSITLDAALEIAAAEAPNGTAPAALNIPLFFGGAPTVVIGNGCPLVLSDRVGLAAGMAGAVIWLRYSVLVSASQFVPTNFVASTTGEGCFITSGASQSPGTGVMTGTTTSTGYGPVAVIGTTYTAQPSVVLIGDSITAGSGDIGVGDAFGNRGFAQRGLSSVGGYRVPSLRFAKSGDVLYGPVLSRGAGSRRAIWPYATHAFVALGTNDCAAGRGLTAMQADAQALWADLREAGLKVAHSKIMPRTTSTDGWTSEANQTPVADFATGGIRDQFNTWLDGQVTAGNLDAVIDPNAYVEGAIHGVWKYTGAVASADGVHPASGLHILGAQAVNAWAAGLSA